MSDFLSFSNAGKVYVIDNFAVSDIQNYSNNGGSWDINTGSQWMRGIEPGATGRHYCWRSNVRAFANGFIQVTTATTAIADIEPNIILRYVDVNNHLILACGSTLTTLYERIASNYTEVGSGWAGAAYSNVVKIVASGTDVTVYVDGVSRISGTTAHTSAGYAGFSYYANVDTNPEARFSSLSIMET